MNAKDNAKILPILLFSNIHLSNQNHDSNTCNEKANVRIMIYKFYFDFESSLELCQHFISNYARRRSISQMGLYNVHTNMRSSPSKKMANFCENCFVFFFCVGTQTNRVLPPNLNQIIGNCSLCELWLRIMVCGMECSLCKLVNSLGCDQFCGHAIRSYLDSSARLLLV